MRFGTTRSGLRRLHLESDEGLSLGVGDLRHDRQVEKVTGSVDSILAVAERGGRSAHPGELTGERRGSRRDDHYEREIAQGERAVEVGGEVLGAMALEAREIAAFERQGDALEVNERVGAEQGPEVAEDSGVGVAAGGVFAAEEVEEIAAGEGGREGDLDVGRRGLLHEQGEVYVPWGAGGAHAGSLVEGREAQLDFAPSTQFDLWCRISLSGTALAAAQRDLRVFRSRSASPPGWRRCLQQAIERFRPSDENAQPLAQLEPLIIDWRCLRHQHRDDTRVFAGEPLPVP